VEHACTYSSNEETQRKGYSLRTGAGLIHPSGGTLTGGTLSLVYEIRTFFEEKVDRENTTLNGLTSDRSDVIKLRLQC
jgi:hypothetical protein